MPGARTYRIGNTFPAFFQERTIYNRRSSCNTWTACPVTTRSAALRTNKLSGQRGSQWTTCPVSTRPAAIYLSMHVSIYVSMYVCMYQSMYLSKLPRLWGRISIPKNHSKDFRAVLHGQRVWPIGWKSSAQVGKIARNGVCVCVHKKEHAHTHTRGKSSA